MQTVRPEMVEVVYIGPETTVGSYTIRAGERGSIPKFVWERWQCDHDETLQLWREATPEEVASGARVV